MASCGAEAYLDTFVGSRTPGLQYLAVNSAGSVLEYNAGWADIQHARPMDGATTLMAYSMSKTVTAAAVLQLVQAREIALDDTIGRHLKSGPYGGGITIRELLCHTAGIPNPIPLRWVHPVSQQKVFDEPAALAAVLRKHPRARFSPGARYAYSNIGYWLLGQIVAQVTGQTFTSYVSGHVFRPLGISPRDLSYDVCDSLCHSQGYLERYSVLNLVKWLLIDSELIGTYEGRWLRIEPHYVNGPAFGGLVGTTRGFGIFLQDQLRPRSMLFDEETKDLFYAQQKTRKGWPVPMTLGWHVGGSGKVRFYYKEGGGGGFHSMMRMYRDAKIATIVMGNATGFDAGRCLDLVDSQIL